LQKMAKNKSRGFIAKRLEILIASSTRCVISYFNPSFHKNAATFLRVFDRNLVKTKCTADNSMTFPNNLG